MAQVAAKILGVPIGYIKVKSSNSLTNPNGMTTGGSIGSELNCLVSQVITLNSACSNKLYVYMQGTKNACGVLNGRIQPIKTKNPDLSWEELVQKCYSEGVDLSAKYL